MQKPTENINQIEEKQGNKELYAGMLLGKNLVKFQIDCGATCNIIPINGPNQDTLIKNSDKILLMYNRTELRPVGKSRIKIAKKKWKKY